MKNINLITLLLISALFSGQAHAGLHFEPQVYYAWGEGAEKNTTNDYTLSGLQYGARMGLYKPRFHFGLEYKTGSLKIDNDSLSQKIDTEVHLMGAYLGFYLKKRYGLNFSYFPAIRHNSDLNSSSSKLSGTGWAIELVYRVRTHLQFKFGYQHEQLSQDEILNQNLTNKIENKTILIGIGLPFVL